MERLADEADLEAVRNAAEEALKGDAGKISEFLRTGQHQAAADEYRVRVVQIANGSDRAVQDAAKAALKDGSTAKFREFLNEGQFAARTSDEQVRAVQLAGTGGPEVKAAAQVALAGPPQLLHVFVQAGQFKAARKDQLTATHVADVKRIIAQASVVAATAQQNAAEAARVAAIARKAADDAKTYARQAQDSADKAKGYAADAESSAKQAEASAADAARSAKAARDAEASAHRDARNADSSAIRAESSAAGAQDSAAAAYEASDTARASAVAAGKDAATAGKAAKEAFTAYVTKAREEAEALRREEEARKRKIERQKQEEAKRKSKLGFLKDLGHMALDVVGAVPGVGTIANGANCAWYGAEGDYLNAGLSCAAAIPFAGEAATAIKLAKWGKKGDLLEDTIGAGVTACNSFTPETPVVLANGSTKPIKDIKPRESVLATDPRTGRTEARSVDDTIVGEGQKHLVKLTVDTDGDKGGATGTVTATAGHPFWLADKAAWAKAGEIKPGSMLRTSTGTWVKVTATRAWSARQQVFNLSVNGIHTYYVQAGTAPVLVHNSSCKVGHVVGKGDDPLVPELVESINARYPGHVRAQGLDVVGADGKTLTDFDVVTRNAVIQVKTGSGKGALKQALTTQRLTDYPVIVYLPQGRGSVIKSLEKAGVLVTKDKNLLLDVLAP